RRREQEGEGVVGVQRGGGEGPRPGGAGHGVRHVVVVDPGDAGAGRHRERGRREGEVVDDNPLRPGTRRWECGTAFAPRTEFRSGRGSGWTTAGKDPGPDEQQGSRRAAGAHASPPVSGG